MQTFIPILLKPRVIALKNRWTRFSLQKRFLARDLVLMLIGLFVAVSLYGTCRAGLTYLKTYGGAAGVDPAIFLNIGLSFLFVLLFLSNLIGALSSLFLAEDLDLILASSLRPRRFFVNKVLEIFIGSTWVLILFGGPAILAFFVVFGKSIAGVLAGAAVLALYVALPTLLALILVPMFGLVMPLASLRAGMIMAAILIVLMLYYFLSLPYQQPITADPRALPALAEKLNWIHTIWSPAALCVPLLETFVLGNGNGVIAPLTGLVAVSSSALLLAGWIMRRWYFPALSITRSARQNMRLRSIAPARALGRIFPSVMSQQSRALLSKELKFFTRDMTQLLQLFLLILLSVVYLCNFSLVGMVEAKSPLSAVIWKVVLVLSNLAMGAFVTIALSTRFVYTSISREGRAFWIIQSSPMSLRSFMRAKFWGWLLPVGFISIVILCTGAMAVQAEPELLLITFITSMLLSYGIVGLAVGFGAIFSNFEWDNPSQLSANLGGLMYMLSGTLLTLLSLFPVGIASFVCRLDYAAWGISTTEWGICIGSGLLSVLVLNLMAVRWGLQAGHSALSRS